MAEQEKDTAFWAEPVRIGLTRDEWDVLDPLAMLADLLRGEELKIPHKAAFYEFVAGREEAALHAMPGLAEELHRAGVMSDAEFAGFTHLPARKEGKLVFAEMPRQEAGASLTACHGVVLILGRLHNEFQRLAKEQLPSEPDHRKNLGLQLVVISMASNVVCML